MGGQLNWQVRGTWFFAGQSWSRFLHRWWTQNRLEPSKIKRDPIFLVEVLDFHSGMLWVYHRDRLCEASREFFKTRKGIKSISLSQMSAVAAATAFPVAFPGLSTDGGRHLFKDAGVIDNLAMMPLLQILRHVPPYERIGDVDFWFLSDAGKPLPVPSEATLDAVASSVPVKRLGLLDRVFRLTGDLAQPQFVKIMSDVLIDYARIRMFAIAIGISAERERPWITPRSPSGWKPANVPTALIYIPRELAVCIMAEGAQAASLALCDKGLMNPQQRSELETFFAKLAA